MARRTIQDYLQVFPFWLLDVSPIEAGSIPVLNPLSGFSSVTAPEITIQTKEVREGNWPFPTKIPQTADVSNITLQKGVTFFNSDFWRWTVATLTGNTEWEGLASFRVGGKSFRRDLLLVNFFNHNPISGATAAASEILSGVGLDPTALPTQIFPFDIALRVPARAYLLKQCFPVRYKVGGDFDARSSEISIAELELAYEYFEEISLSST